MVQTTAARKTLGSCAMPIDPIMPLVYVQDMGPTAKLAHDVAARPEMAQAAAKTAAEESAREERQQVQKTEAGDQSGGINADGGGGGGGAFADQNRKERQEEDESSPEHSDPFVGKLVNRKV